MWRFTYFCGALSPTRASELRVAWHPLRFLDWARHDSVWSARAQQSCWMISACDGPEVVYAALSLRCIVVLEGKPETIKLCVSMV